MKRISSLILVIATLLACLSVNAFAASGDISIVINNEKVEFTANSGKPFVDENNRTQVPLRVVMEQYGCKVDWSSSNYSAEITKDGTTVIVPIGKSYILINDVSVSIDTAAVIKNGRTYLPIRPVLEAFGAQVDWENGRVTVTAPTTSSFNNIYIDGDGNLIFELANGNKINAGTIPEGKKGETGVSVTDAYVDSKSNLVIVLSNGQTINAGNVGTGGSMSDLTFADYAVGTKFYLMQPTGDFDVTVYIDNTPYVVKISNVYYELTANYEFNDENAWYYEDEYSCYLPYQVTMRIDGVADEALAGKRINMVFRDINNGGWSYMTTINADGSFNIDYTQGNGKDNVNVWYKPKQLFFNSLSIY